MSEALVINNINQQQQELVLSFLQNRSATFPRTDLIHALEKTDKAYHLEQRDSEEKDAKSRYDGLDVAIVSPNADSDHSFYADTFLSSVPIFSAVSSVKDMDAAKSVDAKISKEAKEFAWVANLSKCLLDVSKYNKSLAEVVWKEKHTTKIETDTTNDDNIAASSVTFAGNAIKWLDLYNCIWDTSVPLSELAEHGEYAAYTEQLTQIALFEELREMSDVPDTIINVPDEMWQSAFNNGEVAFEYKRPNFWREENSDTLRPGETNWEAHLGRKDKSADGIDYQRYYQRTVLYARVIPKMLGFSSAKVPKNHMPHVMKFVIVNNKYVVHADVQTDLHGYLPILGLTAKEDSSRLKTKSPAEMTLGHQKTAKKMQDRMFAILDRMIGDRGIYDPQRISAESISSNVPDAKIPARPSALNGLEGVYKQLQFDPGNISFMQSMMQFVQQGAENTAGINKSQQGQFVKGNKTLGEWQDVMGNADSKQFVRAMFLEATFFSTLKYLIKTNIFQYQRTEELYSESERTVVRINPAEVRRKVIDFRLTDGLKSAEKMLNSGGLEYMLQLILQVPEFRQQYDAPTVFAYLMMQARGVDLREFRLTPEQQQQMLALEQQRNNPQPGNTGNPPNPQNMM